MGEKKVVAISASPTVNAPEDKLAVSSMIRPRKDMEHLRDKEVQHPRDANPAIRMISNANAAIRMVNKQEPALQARLIDRFVSNFNRDSVTKI